MKKHHIHISYLLPLLSLLVILFFLITTKPDITGLTIADNQEQTFDASLSLTTNENELLPENAEIIILFNNQGRSLTVKEFIEKTNQNFHYTTGELPLVNYQGKGYTGDYSYNLNLSTIGFNTSLEPGSYPLQMSIVYQDIVLSENNEVIELQ
jgi:hypothetical protein